MRAHSKIPWQLRFWLRVWPRGDCWEWRGQRDGVGYGHFGMGSAQSQASGAVSAHRMAYEQAKGTIPPGYQVDHICRHKWCVKPSHLEAVLPRTNTLRGNNPAAQNSRKPTCPRCRSEYELDSQGKRFCRLCRNEGARKRIRALSPEKRSARNRAAMDWYYKNRAAD